MNAVLVGVVEMNQAVLNKYVAREVAFTVGSVRPMANGKRLKLLTNFSAAGA